MRGCLRGLTPRRQNSLLIRSCQVVFSPPSSSLVLKSIGRYQYSYQLIARKGYMSQSYDPITKSECPEGKTVIIEGSASMLYDTSEAVFYNKVQVLNRDLSIRVISHFAETIMKERKEKLQRKQEARAAHERKQRERIEEEGAQVKAPPKDQKKDDLQELATLQEKGIHILDALAATGLRSVRYLKEIPNVRCVTINDLVPEAVEVARENCTRNGVDPSRVIIEQGDACMLMYNHREDLTRYDVVDLDPYGTAAPFLDSAVQAVADGGLLCVTCTDSPVLCGTYPEKCFSLYGSVPLRSKYLHEQALRILLHSIDSTANKYKRYIVPWISVSVDFYVRVFVRVFESPAEVKKSCLRRSYVYQSTRCPSFYLQPMAVNFKQGNFHGAAITAPSACEETDGKLKIGGPIWSAPIHQQDVVDNILKTVIDYGKTQSGDEGVPSSSSSPLSDVEMHISTHNRLTGLLSLISEELKDVPLYYTLPELASTVHLSTPVMLEIQAAIVNAGYRFSSAHHEPTSIKTDAPPSVVWDIMRAYSKINPPLGSKKRDKRRPEGQQDVGELILSKEPKIEVDFKASEALKQLLRSRPDAARFPYNPEANWGPKGRAGKTEAQKEKSKEKMQRKLEKRREHIESTRQKRKFEAEQATKLQD